MLDMTRFSETLRSLDAGRSDIVAALDAVSGLGRNWRERIAGAMEVQGWQPWTLLDEGPEPGAGPHA